MIRKFFIFLLLAASVGFIWWDQDNDFTLQEIAHKNKPFPQSTSKSYTDETTTLAILNQPFLYLAHGNQSVVFRSLDGQAVIKLFRFGTFRPSPISEKLKFAPVFRKRYATAKRWESSRIEKAFRGYEVAETLAPQRAALLMTHLNLEPVETSPLTLTLIDREGQVSHINLQETPFILQRTVTPLRDLVSLLLDQGDVETTVQRLQAVLDMVATDLDAGIFDHDRNILYNTGYLDNAPVRQDVGKWEQISPERGSSIKAQEMDHLLHVRIEGWLHRHYPQYKEQVMEKLQI